MWRRKRMMQGLDEDIREHIARETQDNIERGMSPEEARHAAMRKFGNVTRVKEETQEVWSFLWLEQLWQDIRYGLRMLAKSPGFAAVAILTLALGIGANTAIFSLIDAVLLRSLPVEKPSQLVLLKWSARKAPNIHGYQSAGDCASDLRFGASNPSGCSFSEPIFREVAQANVFSGTAAFANAGRLNLSGNGPASVINGQLVSGDFFRTMGLKAAIGRLIDANDDTAAAASVTVLNYGYWQSAFGGTRDVIGRTIELNNVAFTIIGVAEQRFTGISPGSDYDVWVPLSDGQRINSGGLVRWNDRQADVSYWWLTVVGRVKPGYPDSPSASCCERPFPKRDAAWICAAVPWGRTDGRAAARGWTGRRWNGPSGNDSRRRATSGWWRSRWLACADATSARQRPHAGTARSAWRRNAAIRGKQADSYAGTPRSNTSGRPAGISNGKGAKDIIHGRR